MKHPNFFCLFLLLLLAGCKPKTTAPDAAGPDIKSYDARGIVRQIAPDRAKATIKHEAIPGLMPAMTMEFTVRETNELNGISPDDEITFRLVMRKNDHWIEKVHFVAHTLGDTNDDGFAPYVPGLALKPGDLLPDYELMAEDGKPIHFSEFRGRVVAFTFFFSRCPLPDYCPRMSKNFAEARQLMASAPGAPTNWQFLSISFDPEFDQPAVLAASANFFREGNTNRWLFAAAATNTLADLAPRLDLIVIHEDGGISHNLRTVVLDPQGRIYRQFDGNAWTPQQLVEAMVEAARGPTGIKPR